LWHIEIGSNENALAAQLVMLNKIGQALELHGERDGSAGGKARHFTAARGTKSRCQMAMRALLRAKL
jgi:hypothetical protein